MQIKRLDGALTFTDLLDNHIISVKLAINESIEAAAKMRWSGTIKFNQFIDGHQRLKNAQQDGRRLNLSRARFSLRREVSKKISASHSNRCLLDFKRTHQRYGTFGMPVIIRKIVVRNVGVLKAFDTPGSPRLIAHFVDA